MNITKIFEKVYKIFPAIILMILYFTEQIQYNMSDDYVMNFISMGVHTGTPDEHLLIINVILGYVLKGLYIICNLVNWYGIMYLGVILLCTYTILGILQKYMKPICVIGIVIIFELTLVFWFTFTVLGYVSTGIAAIKYIDYIDSREHSRKKKIFDIFLIVLLFMSGYMLRNSAFVTAVILMGPLFSINIRKILEKRSHIIILFGVVLCVILSYGIQKQVCDNELWNSYYSYCSARSEVLDYPLDEYINHEKELNKLSISSNDYKMLETWHFTDKSVFSEEILKKIDGFKKFDEKYNFNVIKIVQGMIQTKEAWIFIIICLLFIYIDKKNLKYYLIQGLFTYGMVAAVFVRNRPVLRVMVPLYILGFLCILYIFIKEGNVVYTVRKKSVLMVVTISIVGLLGCYAVMNYNLTKSNEINVAKYEKTRAYINHHKENLYVTDLLDSMLYNQSIKNITTEKVYDNIIPFGSWDIYNSTYYDIIDKYNLKYDDRLIIDLVENDNIRCMLRTSDKGKIEMIEQFLTEHTGKSVESKLEDIIDNEDIAIYNISYIN